MMEDTRILVRPKEPSDYAAVVELIGEWRKDAAYRLRRPAERDTWDAVAERAGRIVGWIRYQITVCNSELLAEYEDSAERWLFVVEVYSSHAERRQGIGRKLMRYAEAKGRQEGVRHSVLIPTADSGTPSGIAWDLSEFYGSLGYELMQPSPKYVGSMPPWLMGLEL